MTDESRTSHGDTDFYPLVALLPALAAFAVYGVSVMPWGVGASPDSIHYVTTARNLLAGEGFRTWFGAPLVDWPPLTSLFLAALMLPGLEALEAAKLLHGFAYGLLAWIVAVPMTNGFHSTPIRLLCGFGVPAGIALHETFIMVWSEPLFIVFVTFTIVALGKYSNDPVWRWLVAAAFCAACAALTRYAGITAIALVFGFVALFSWRLGWGRRMLRAAIAGLIAAVPPGAWVARNYAITGTLTGSRASTPATLADQLRAFQITVTEWFIPADAAAWLVLLLNGGAFALLVGAVVARRAMRSEAAGMALAAALFVSIYTVFILAASSLVAFDAISNRLLAPIYIPLLFLVGYVVDSLARAMATRGVKPKAVVHAGLALGLALALAYPGYTVWQRARFCATNGVPGYTDRSWQESATLAWLRDNGLDGVVYSNGADIMSLHRGIPEARLTPNTDGSLKAFQDRVASGERTYVVWFNRNINPWLYQIDPRAIPSARVVAALDDGVIFTFPR